MNKNRGRRLLESALRRNTYERLLEKYIAHCRPEEDEESVRGSGAKNQKRIEGKFPNLAGFCRFLKIGTEDLLGFSEEFPEAVAYILAVFEDEALNSSVSPTLLTAYLKRRLGYERELDRKERPIPADALPVIRFEHDVYGDGE